MTRYFFLFPLGLVQIILLILRENNFINYIFKCYGQQWED